MIGTAFSEKDKETGAVPVWKQEARDERGKQRFHGAWTGGFTAGHFGTVGSAEGWQPTQFRSSRGARATPRAPMAAEEFMDDEDKRDILSESLTARPEFKSLSSTTQEDAKSATATASSSPAKVGLEELLAPVQFTIGVMLLRKMGWRKGRTIGGKRAELQKTVASGGDYSDDDGDSSYAAAAEGDPNVAHVVTVIPKNDTRGIGFDPARDMPELVEARDIRNTISAGRSKEGGGGTSNCGTRGSRLAFGVSGSGGQKTSRFGLSALEDPDEFDDVYAADDMSSYDVHIGDDARQRGQQKGPSSGVAAVLARVANSSSVKSAARSSTGDSSLKGFVSSSGKRGALVQKWFPPPVVPKDFVPYHRFETTVNIPTDIMPNLTPAMRSALLGERVLPTFKESVFSHMDEEARQRLANASGKPIPGPFGSITMPQRKQSQATEKPVDTATPQRKRLPDSVLKAPARVVYPSDPQKQRRYEQFLEEQRSNSSLEHAPSSGMTEWEWAAEREEFFSVAIAFRPAEGVFASRFAPPSSTPETNRQQNVITDAPVSIVKPVRTVTEWVPAPLLCKRFNVPNPHPDKPVSRGKGTAGGSEPDAMAAAVVPSANLAAPVVSSGSGDAAAVPVKEEIIDAERPPIDLFKAIFEDAPEEENKEEANEPEITAPVEATKPRATFVAAEIAAVPDSVDNPKPVFGPAESAGNATLSRLPDFIPLPREESPPAEPHVWVEAATLRAPKRDREESSNASDSGSSSSLSGSSSGYKRKHKHKHKHHKEDKKHKHKHRHHHHHSRHSRSRSHGTSK